MARSVYRVLRHTFTSLALLALLAAVDYSGGAVPTPISAALAASPATQVSELAWQAKWKKVVAAAKKEGKVTVFGPPGGSVRRGITGAFQKAFPGITVEWSGGRGNGQAAKIQTERNAGIYSRDILIQGILTFHNVITPMNVLQTIDDALILPDVKDPTKWRGGKLQLSADRKNIGVGFAISPDVIYNTKLVKKGEIKTTDDLLNPKWKGRFALNNPLPAGSGFNMYREFLAAWGDEKRVQMTLRKLKENAGVVDRNQQRIIRDVARGKYAFAVKPSGGTLGQLWRSGLRVGVIPKLSDQPRDFSNSFGTIMRLDRPPHPNAQIVFINWFLSKDGQKTWVISMNMGSRRLDAPSDHLPVWAKPTPGLKYKETNPIRTPKEQKFLESVFGR